MLPPFYQDTTFFLIPYYGNNDTLRKERELSLLPSSTVFRFFAGIHFDFVSDYSGRAACPFASEINGKFRFTHLVLLFFFFYFMKNSYFSDYKKVFDIEKI